MDCRAAGRIALLGIVTGRLVSAIASGDAVGFVCPSQFSPSVIRHPVWLYLRFPLSFRGFEDLLAERGLDASYETVRRWVAKFATVYAKGLRADVPSRSDGGISARCSSRSVVDRCICGAL